jgi:acyl-CoA synthetase (AMP-forming)/AMP-acid ligase II
MSLGAAQTRPDLDTFEVDWRHTGFLPDPARTFPQVVKSRIVDAHGARRGAEPIAFTVVKADAHELKSRAIRYRRAHRMMLGAAAELQQAGVGSGDRVLLCVARPEDFFAFFMACQGLRAIPVPLPSITEFKLPTAFQDRIRSVAKDCTPRALVVDSLSRWQSIAEGSLKDIHVVDAASTSKGSERAPEVSGFNLDRSFDEPAFLQYTSGSTGSPRGVVVDHYNLVANFRAIVETAGFGATDRSFSWLPLFHDMGLIGGFLLGIYMGTPTYVMEPKYFVLRPEAWLRGLSESRATYTVGPNFAYNIVARRLPDRALAGLDLSALRLAFDGAEPIDAETARAFVERLSRCGIRNTAFYPVYGLAECTLGAAFPDPETPLRTDRIDRAALGSEQRAVPVSTESTDDALEVVSVGSVVRGHRLRVLALDSDDPLPDRFVGEIAISGPSVARGYYNQPNSLVREHRTGDLGYLADGQLYIVDRLKDLIIVAGNNLAPTDIERVVGEIPGLMRGSAVALGVRSPNGTEDLVIVAAVDPSSWRILDEIKKAVRARVLEYFGVTASDICLVAPGSIPKTSSGKVQRAACRALYESDTLDLVEGVAGRLRIKVRQAKRRVETLVAQGRRASEFPPPSKDSVPPSRS